MNFLIIMPAHNEAQHLAASLESLRRQTHQEFSLVVVNDGSTDDTAEILSSITNFPQLQFFHLEKSTHEPGAKVVRTFYSGLSKVTEWEKRYDAVCKFDADVIFPPNYLAAISEAFDLDSNLGLVSGLVFVPGESDAIEKGDLLEFHSQKGWVYEDIAAKDHVRGPVKAYRTAAFLAMGGLRPVLGWDNLDVMLLARAGWESRTLTHLRVKHLRPTAYAYSAQKFEKLGQYFRNIGLRPALAAIAAGKVALKERSVLALRTMIKSYYGSPKPAHLSADEIIFINRYRWQKIFRKIKKAAK